MKFECGCGRCMACNMGEPESHQEKCPCGETVTVTEQFEASGEDFGECPKCHRQFFAGEWGPTPEERSALKRGLELFGELTKNGTIPKEVGCGDGGHSFCPWELYIGGEDGTETKCLVENNPELHCKKFTCSCCGDEKKYLGPSSPVGCNSCSAWAGGY